MKKDHNGFEELASRYVEIYGEKLAQENKKTSKRYWDTAGLDEKVLNRLYKKKRIKKYAGAFGLLAACMLIFFLYKPATDSSQQAEDTTDAPGFQYEVIPLNFTMPEGYEINHYEQDYGETIYYIYHNQGDDVVLSLTEGDTVVLNMDAKEFFMADTVLYGVTTPEYKYLTFEKDGLVYQLSCRYDIGTLLALCEEIIIF